MTMLLSKDNRLEWGPSCWANGCERGPPVKCCWGPQGFTKSHELFCINFHRIFISFSCQGDRFSHSLSSSPLQSFFFLGLSTYKWFPRLFLLFPFALSVVVILFLPCKGSVWPYFSWGEIQSVYRKARFQWFLVPTHHHFFLHLLLTKGREYLLFLSLPFLVNGVITTFIE